MRIHVHVIPGSKSVGVEKQGQDIYGYDVYRVKISEKPIGGEANKGLVDALAAFFSVPKRNITVVSGHTSRQKLIEIL